MSALVAEVYAVGSERNGVKRASDACKKLKYANVFHQSGDPLDGWSESAPFDKIVVTRAIEEIPESLVDQLNEGGRLVAPVGDRYHQKFVLGVKRGEELQITELLPTCIELLTGAPPNNLPAPSILGGGFEETEPFTLSRQEAKENDEESHRSKSSASRTAWRFSSRVARRLQRLVSLLEPTRTMVPELGISPTLPSPPSMPPGLQRRTHSSGDASGRTRFQSERGRSDSTSPARMRTPLSGQSEFSGRRFVNPKARRVWRVSRRES